MRCPFCSHTETQVVDSRVADEGDFIRRRRECQSCHKRFTTYERADLSFPRIVKKDGRRVPYVPAKLRASMDLALRKRPVETDQIDAAVAHVEDKLLSQGVRELPSSRLGEWVMEELAELDQVAYVRFASVYSSFNDLEDFRLIIDRVKR